MNEMTSPHSVRDPDSEMREIFALWNPESGKILLEKSGILGSGIWSKVQGIRNPSNEWNPESRFHWQRLGSSTWNPQFTTWKPESKTSLDFLSWDEWISTVRKNTKKMWRYLPCTKPKNIFSSCISRLGTKVTARVNKQSKRPRIRPVAINCILCTRALHFDPYGDCQACAINGKRRSLRERPTTSV